jgi:hypothetical protein
MYALLLRYYHQHHGQPLLLIQNDFPDRMKRDRVMDMKKWASKVKRTIKEERGRRKSINLAIVSANNHYAGFGPGTASDFPSQKTCQLSSICHNFTQ